MSDEPTPAEPATKETAPAERAKALYYSGEVDAKGNATQSVTGVPARDLDEFDLRVLSDEEYATALASGLYKKSKKGA